MCTIKIFENRHKRSKYSMQMLATKVSKYIVYSTETQHPRRLYIVFAIAKEIRSTCFFLYIRKKRIAKLRSPSGLWKQFLKMCVNVHVVHIGSKNCRNLPTNFALSTRKFAGNFLWLKLWYCFDHEHNLCSQIKLLSSSGSLQIQPMQEWRNVRHRRHSISLRLRRRVRGC